MYIYMHAYVYIHIIAMNINRYFASDLHLNRRDFVHCIAKSQGRCPTENGDFMGFTQ